MKRSRVALYEFMPYGAPELLESGEAHLTRALTTTMAVVVALYVVALVVGTYVVHHGGAVLPPIDRTFELQPPPPMDVPQIQQPQVMKPSVPVTGVVPLPVPDRTAPVDVTVPSQDQLSHQGPAETSSRGEAVAPPIVIERPPAINEWVPFDEAPVAVTAVKPVYPDLAREADVEGTVLMRVLVGTDGRVKDVHVDRSVPLLDEAAVAAARQWVFTPALSNHHPVAVWVAIPVRFSLH